MSVIPMNVADCSGYLAKRPAPTPEGETAQIHVLEPQGLLLTVELFGHGVGRWKNAAIGSRVNVRGVLEPREDSDGVWKIVLAVRG